MTDRTSSSTAGCNSPMTESMESERPAFTSEHRHQCLRCTECTLNWSPNYRQMVTITFSAQSPSFINKNPKDQYQDFLRPILLLFRYQDSQKISNRLTLFFVSCQLVLVLSCFFWTFHLIKFHLVLVYHRIYLLEKRETNLKTKSCKDHFVRFCWSSSVIRSTWWVSSISLNILHMSSIFLSMLFRDCFWLHNRID